MLPTGTNVSMDVQTALPRDADAVVVFAAQGGKISGDTTLVLRSAEFENAQRMVRLGVIKGKLKEVDFDLLDTGKKVRRIYVSGLGPADKIDREIIRKSAGALFRTLRKHRIAHAAIVPPVIHYGHGSMGSGAMAEGLLLAAFDYREYRDANDSEIDEPTKSMRLSVLSSKNDAKVIKESIDRARLLCAAQNFARTIAFRPGNDVNPPRLAQIAQQACREVGLRCRVLDEKQ